VEEQIAIIYCGTKGLLRPIPVNKVKEFEKDFLSYLDVKHKNVMNDLKAGKYTDEITKVLDEAAKEISKKYN